MYGTSAEGEQRGSGRGEATASCLASGNDIINLEGFSFLSLLVCLKKNIILSTKILNALHSDASLNAIR